MPYVGHCNCDSIRITLAEQPANSVVCHCLNCRKAGGVFSVNYLTSEEETTVEDPKKTLTAYDDSNTAEGHTIQRYFCSTCGSPVLTKSPKIPGKMFLKATLFDTIAPCGMEVFEATRVPLFK